jgi:RNA polymerase sigma-70 factor, ECF subfamily
MPSIPGDSAASSWFGTPETRAAVSPGRVAIAEGLRSAAQLEQAVQSSLRGRGSWHGVRSTCWLECLLGGSVDDTGRQHRDPLLMTSPQTPFGTIHRGVVDADAPRKPANVHSVDGSANRNNEASSDETDFRSSFERAALPMVGPLYRHALRMTRNRVDADDLLQDTMAKAYEAFGSFKNGTDISAWLHRIMTNTYITGYRKNKRRPTVYPLDDWTDQQTGLQTFSDITRSAEDQVLGSLPDNKVKAAMEALPHKFRLAVYYADVEGYRYTEIAELMGTSAGTVMSRLHRGRRRLRQLLDPAHAQEVFSDTRAS